MFTKGPRFEPLKVPDVPGPNAYNVSQDSALESYKRGAFLEKQDRFIKDKHPVSSGPSNKPSTSSAKPPLSQPPIEKYNELQKKVEDLERVHLEGKKIHQVELERVKQELSSALKASAEHAERFDKQKKQNSVLDARLLELKKANMSDQSEIKELRHKIRVLELERDKISAKQPEISELKKTIASLEAKRKDDMKERDRRIHELEKLLQSEQKKREFCESKNQESKHLFEEERATVRKATIELEGLLHASRSEAQVANGKVHVMEKEAADEKDSLLQRLEQYCHLLNTVAEQYGNLVSQSVASSTYNRLQQEQHALQFRIFRLERKLANSEGQVVELTHLIRQINSQNIHLTQLVSDAFADASVMATFDYTPAALSDPSFLFPLEETHPHDRDQRISLAESDAFTQSLFSTYYQLTSNELHATSSFLLDQCQTAQALAEQRESDLSSAVASHEAIAACLDSTRKEKTELEENFKSTQATQDNLVARVTVLETQLADSQEELHTTILRHAALLKNEKDVTNRLTSTIQKNRMAEDALRAEIERLSTELVEAEGYEEAYNGLFAEVRTLLTRNQIAEEEADRISKVNTELLSHRNPAQRIMYVDRIRRELAEARHKIAMLSQEQENFAAQNDDLQHELDMYKSVAIPPEKKARTHITRILRPPLVNLGNSFNSNTQRVSFEVANSHETVEPNERDMTTDELAF